MKNKINRLFYVYLSLLFLTVGVAAQTTAFVQQGKLDAADSAAQDSLGFSVAISGDTAIVGSPRNTGGTGLQNRGSAYVYVRNGAGAWSLQQKLVPSDGAATDQFGYSVAINGNTAAVGRYNTTTGLNRADGKVYIFTRTGTTWTETQTLQSNDIAQGDLFGSALAFENDTLVVGALGKNNGNNFFQGAAYVFTRAGGAGAFTQQAKLVSNDGGLADFFGYAVAVSGDTVVVGAPGQVGSGAASGRGWAYVFTRSGSSWSLQQKLLASDGAAGDAFGAAVAISGETVVVGARLDTIGTVGGQGSAYVFGRSGAAWTEQQKLLGVETVQRNDTFGYSVAIKGNTIAVGAPAHEFIGSIANHGAVYVFQRNAAGGTFTRTGKLVHNDPAPDALGTSVAFDGTSIISGAPSKNSARGAAYVFAVDTTPQLQKIFASDGEGGSGFGSSDTFGITVAISGNTAIVGAPSAVVGSNPDHGAAYIFVKNGDAWTQQAKLIAADENTNISFGRTVAINGDTAVVGSSAHTVGANAGQGAVYVFVRSGTSWTQQAKLTANDGAANDNFGWSVGISGDTIAVGALRDDVGANADRGSGYIFTRAGTTWTQTAKLTASDGAAQDLFATRAAISGDTVIFGVPNDQVGNNGFQGSAYIFVRNGAVWTEQTKLLAGDGAAGDSFGSGVAIDGNSVVVGAPGKNNGGNTFQGAAYVFVRNGTSWSQQAKLLSSDGTTDDGFGGSVAISGNTALIGNTRHLSGNLPRRGAYIFTRSGNSWTQSRKLSAPTTLQPNNNQYFAGSLALSGGNLIIGSYTDLGLNDYPSGAAYVLSLQTNRPALYDFDGDGKSDLGVFRPSNGTWYLQNSTSGFTGAAFGANGDKIVPADYDGDGKTDIAVFRAGVWYLQRSQAGFTGVSFGAADDIPVPADYDGDGKADIAVFRPSNGTWYLQRSSQGFTGIAFGQAGDKPTIGDFDGDGKADVAVYRPSNGGWYRINSSDNQVAAVQFGIAEDSVVPADYDGDGKTDVAVFRPSTGTWYLQRSQLGFTGVAFGQAGDKLVPADYDGDGKADIAVYRAGAWYLQRSTQGFTGVAFGAGDDLPAPNAFVR